MSTNPSPELKSLFETALNDFEKRTGTNLVQHEIIDKLVNCESADSIMDVVQQQAQAFRKFRGDGGKLLMWLNRTAKVLYTLSTSDVVKEGVSLVCVYSLRWQPPRNLLFLQPLPPARAIFAGLAILLGVCVLPEFSREDSFDTCGLHQTIKDISKSYDALIDLFESFESFVRRLDIYTKIPSTTVISEIIVKILIEMLSTISLAIQQAKQGRLSEPHPHHYDAF
jgi:hypothetical protein